MDDQNNIHTTYEKLYKLSKKHEKLYRLTTKKLSDVKLDHKELSTKFNEANQTIRALRFENNFLAEKTKKLEAELCQVRAQLEWTSSAKLDEMLSIQKSASDQIGLGYGLSSSNTWWIDRDWVCMLDSFSTHGGSIEFLFLILMS